MHVQGGTHKETPLPACSVVDGTPRLLTEAGVDFNVVNVTIDYLEGTSFLLCRSYCRMFPLGLCQYLEDRYVFSLGPQYFSLAPFSQDAPTPVSLLLFSS